MFKPAGGIYVCADGSYLTRLDDSIRIWEELGRQITDPLGINDNSNGPQPKHATLSGIPLPALAQGYTLFSTGINTCGPSSASGARCPGLTGIANNYDSNARSHSFIYVVYFYLTDGAKIRNWAATDAATSNTLLQLKYNWVKQNIFRGVEF